MKKPDRYLIKRGNYWFYKRRIPKQYRSFDEREFIRKTLGTSSLEIARLRRDALEQADNDFWTSMAFHNDDADSSETQVRVRSGLARKYKAACSRALARGFVYAPAEKLVEQSELSEIIDRIKVIQSSQTSVPTASHEAETAALLGGVEEPAVTVWEAFDTYCSEIAVGDLINKSPKQRSLWMKTKKRGVNYFTDLIGDKPIAEISREDALKYYNWWAARLIPKNGEKPLKANTANRDIGNMRQLYTAYFKHLGDDRRDNPFRNLSFKDSSPTRIPPFEDDWVRRKIIVPGAFGELNIEASSIVYAMIETGCRPSEIANLLPDDIKLNAPVPFIRIRPKQGMEIKTVSSIRDVPLVGISLKAMQKCPDGFRRYRDKNDSLSQILMKTFRARGLFPTKDHVIYSFRHAFEKRMLEAGLDYGFRCMIMGHRNTRPKYGDGGSMEYRRDQLLKIAHPIAQAHTD